MIKPEIREDQQDEAVQERDPLIAVIDPEQRGADALGQQQADGAAEKGAQQLGDRRCGGAAIRVRPRAAARATPIPTLIRGSAPSGRSMNAE